MLGGTLRSGWVPEYGGVEDPKGEGGAETELRREDRGWRARENPGRRGRGIRFKGFARVFFVSWCCCSVLLHRGNLAWHDLLVDAVQHEMNWFTG